MVEQESVIAQWYNGRSIFISGGSGFMGKVLIEKLLYSCKGVKCIYLLMRDKKGKTAFQRLEEMWKLPCFERVRNSQPSAIQKLIPVIGQLGMENLGLSERDERMLKENVSVIFHCAATLRMEETLKLALSQNVGGTAEMLELAKKMKNLKVFIYFSTAFCIIEPEVIEERVYYTSMDPKTIMELARCVDDETMIKITPELIKPHPNTYTYTKQLGEVLVANEANNLSVCIIRPTIVIPALKEPVEGWVDSLNGPVGLLVVAGKGILRSMYCKRYYHAHCVPVDMAIWTSIVAAQRLGTAKEKPKEVLTYNLTQHKIIPITWGEVLDIAKKSVIELPFEQQIWYPDGDIRSNLYVHYIYSFFFHWIPALFIDGLLTIFRQKRFMVRLHKRIHNGLAVLQFFTTRMWKFDTVNFFKLQDTMTESDLKVFPLDARLDVHKYFRNSHLGARTYCMKEDPASLPRCQRIQKILYVVHKATVYGFYFWMIHLLSSYSETVRMMLEVIRDLLASLPIIGYFFKTI